MRIYERKAHIPYRWQTHVLDNLSRFNVIVAPRQRGKTELMVEIINAVAHMPVPSSKRSIQINLCSDTAKRTYRLYSKAMNKVFHPYKPESKKEFWTNETQTELNFKRDDGMEVSISILGSVANPTGPKGTAADLNVIDEAGKVSLEFIEEGAFQATTKTEGINIVTGTVEPNDYYKLFRKAQKKMDNGSNNWFAFYMAWGDEWDKDTLSDRARDSIYDSFDFDDPKDALRFEKEQMCNWLAGLEGTPYAKEYIIAHNSGRVRKFPVMQGMKVGTSWDDGRGTTAVWFWQFVNGYFRFVNYREWKESNLPTICDDIEKYYRDNKLTMGFHILPHTMKEKSYTERGSLSRAAQLKKHFRGRGRYVVIPKVSSIESKLNAGKQFFKHCQFDEPGCWLGLNRLQLYARQMNKATGAPSKNIKADDNSHGGDAFGEIAMAKQLGIIGDNLHIHVSPQDMGPNVNIRRFTYPY